jgi:hypothetical protein
MDLPCDAAFLSVVAELLSLIAIRNPVQALLATAVVLAGAPLYWLFFRHRTSARMYISQPIVGVSITYLLSPV